MSQVIRKFENSGKIEQSKPELFERSGVGKYNKADLVAGLYKNIGTYIKNNNLSGDRAISFRNAANQFIKGVENGTITMNGDGTFSDSTGSMASTGKFDKNLIGRKKDTINNAVNLVGDYALKYIDQMQQYTKPAAKPKSKFNIDDFLTKEISKKWYGGNNIDYDNWFKNRTEQERNTLLSEVFNNVNYNQLYQDYDWTDTGINSVEDLANRGRGFSTAISNNKLDNDDYNTFAALGGTGLNKFMKSSLEPVKSTPEQNNIKTWEAEAEAVGATTPEAKSAYIQKKQIEKADRNEAIIKESREAVQKNNRDKFFSDFIIKNPFRETILSGYIPSTVSYKPEDFDKPIKDFYNTDVDQYLNYNLSRDWFKAGNTQHIANHIDYLLNHLKMTLPDAGDGFVAIPSTFDYDNYTAIVYNPTTRQYKETSMLANKALRGLANAYYDNTHTPKKGTGGILYMQFGGTYSANANYNRLQQKRMAQTQLKKEEIKKESEATGRTIEQIKEGRRKPMADDQKWERDDYIRLGAAGADVASIIASFVPGYGTAASGALGVGSTVANFVADMGDGFQSKDLLNAGTGLVMDAIGVVPGFGAASKGNKILKNILKISPKLIAAWSASAAFTPALQAFTKLKDKGAKEMTVDDWKALANGLTTTAGLTRWGASAMRNKRFTNKYGIPYKTVTTKSGKQVPMREDQFQQMKRATGIEEQNKVLQSVAKEEELPTTFKKWYDIKRITQGVPSVNKEVDFSAMELKKTTPDGEVLVPRRLSNVAIWEWAVNNDWGKSFKTLNIGKNSDGFSKKFNMGENWGYKRYTPKTKVGKEQYEQSLTDQDKENLRKTIIETTAKNKGEQQTVTKGDLQNSRKFNTGGAVTANTSTNLINITPAENKRSKRFSHSIMPENVIALSRMIGGLATNNKTAKVYKEGLKPTLLDTFENTVPLQGNFQAKTNAEQQAGNLESVAAMPRTSDASLQLAGELEASDRAGQARFQGGLQDAEMFYKTRMLGQQESDAAKGRRVEVANRNRASMNQIDAAKKQIDASKIAYNYQNVIAPYLAGIENQFLQKRSINQQLDMEEAKRQADRIYGPKFDKLTKDFNAAYKAYGDANNNDYTGWESSDEYKSFLTKRRALNDNVSQFLLDKKKEIAGFPYIFQINKNYSTEIPFIKSGGKLSAADKKKLQRARDFNKRLLEDNKQFHKDIMESKREHNKLIVSMSSLTSELIKKAMS